MSGGPLPRYRELVLEGALSVEPVQALMAENLQILHDRLKRYRPPAPRADFFSLFRRRRPKAPKGLYLHGGVGRGKTMLMDLFYENAGFEPRQRWHFHAFMQHVHAAIANWRRAFDGEPACALHPRQVQQVVPGEILDVLSHSELFKQAYYVADRRWVADEDVRFCPEYALALRDEAGVLAWAPVQHTLGQFIEHYDALVARARVRLTL